MNRFKRRAADSLAVVAAVFGLMLVTLAGCPGTGDPIMGNNNRNDNVNDNSGGTPTFGVLNFMANLSFSDEIVLTVLYSVPSDAETVVGYLQLLNGPADAGGTAIGPEQIIATNLVAGRDQSFVIDTAELRPGFYQIGVRADDATFTSRGTMEIQGPPSPLFLSPSDDLVVEQGVRVAILADVGDPQNMADWRLFFQDPDAPQLEQGVDVSGQLLGTRITEGQGNEVNVMWETRNVEFGTYRLGLSATDIGLTIAATVAAGRAETIRSAYSLPTVTVARPPGAALPPTIDLLTPSQTAFGGETVTIDFNGETFEGDDYVVTIFSVFGGQSTTIATITDRTVASVPFSTAGLTSGLYAIGANISDGRNPVVEVPVPGRVQINVVQVEDTSLTVSAPGQSMRIAQGDTVSIQWTTDVPPGRGNVDVFARQFVSVDQPMGVPGTEVAILNNADTNVSSATWTTTNERGLYVILVELAITDPLQTDTVLESAPGTIRVSLTAPQFWLGQIGQGVDSPRSGEIYQGVNFQDNNGTFVGTAGDINSDGRDDFILGSRFGKPFFQNPSGVGIGEAYLIFGGARQNETQNLNKVALAELNGVSFPGPRTRASAATSTDGLSSVQLVPDQDGDSLPELAFGFPFIDSRGHSKTLIVDDDPFSSATLEQERQFQRGGVVFVGSTNTKLSSPPAEFASDPDAPLELQPVIYLDLVGQNFTNTFPDCSGHWVDLWDLEIEQDGAGNVESRRCVRAQLAGEGDGCPETYRPPGIGFNRDLSGGVASQCFPFSEPTAPQNAGTGADCTCFDARDMQFDTNDPMFNPANNSATGNNDHASLIPFELRDCIAAMSIGGDIASADITVPTNGIAPIENDASALTGSDFYAVMDNMPLEPFGARIIGGSIGTVGMEDTTADKYGSAIAVSGQFLLISAPNRTPVLGEVSGAEAADLGGNGLVYLFNLNNLWPATLDGNPPTPYQYQMGQVNATGIDVPTQCGRSQLLDPAFRVMGELNQQIEFVQGAPDFNLDDREDFIIGAPTESTDDGVVYISYRRDFNVEGDYILGKTSLDPLDPERLAGLRVNGRSGADERFGEVLASPLNVINTDGSLSNRTVDLNGDGFDDIIIGNPNANGGIGEVIVIFATDEFISPFGGISLTDLLTANDADGNPRAVRIAGRAAGDQFGFNVAVVGDFNGDSVNDFLVAAPGASPMFDSDDDGVLDTAGIDVVNILDPESPFGDGAADDIAGAADDLLTDAGEVYLIFGATPDSNNLADIVADRADRTVDISELGTSDFRGVVFVGRQERDALGGGRETKRDKRSFGVGSAGDVDGDGRADLLMGAILADPNGRTDAGESYLIYGFN